MDTAVPQSARLSNPQEGLYMLLCLVETENWNLKSGDIKVYIFLRTWVNLGTKDSVTVSSTNMHAGWRKQLMKRTLEHKKIHLAFFAQLISSSNN